MNFQVTRVSDVAILAVQVSTLDVNNVKDFKEAIAPHLADSRKILLDLGSLEFLDSSGLGAFLSCLRQVNGAGGEMKIFGVSRPVRTLFELVRMHRLLDIFNTREEALRAYQ